MKKKTDSVGEQALPLEPSHELTVLPTEHETRDLAVMRAPAIVLEEAKAAAVALSNVLSAKPKKIVFNGKQYLEFEDWGLLGRFYGITPKITETKYVEFGDVKGFEAKAVAIHVATGAVVSGAEAMCLNDEENWGKRTKYRWTREKGQKPTKVKIGEEKVPIFQLRSMAQTRACAKVLKNVLSWVVVLAGYSPTPAEDMQEYKNPDAPKEEKGNPPLDPGTSRAESSEPVSHGKQGKELPDEQLGNWRIPFGQYRDKTLMEIAGLMDVRTGKAKGVDYLEWCVDSSKQPDGTNTVIIKRFLAYLSKAGA